MPFTFPNFVINHRVAPSGKLIFQMDTRLVLQVSRKGGLWKFSSEPLSNWKINRHLLSQNYNWLLVISQKRWCGLLVWSSFALRRFFMSRIIFHHPAISTSRVYGNRKSIRRASNQKSNEGWNRKLCDVLKETSGKLFFRLSRSFREFIHKIIITYAVLIKMDLA